MMPANQPPVATVAILRELLLDAYRLNRFQPAVAKVGQAPAACSRSRAQIGSEAGRKARRLAEPQLMARVSPAVARSAEAPAGSAERRAPPCRARRRERADLHSRRAHRGYPRASSSPRSAVTIRKRDFATRSGTSIFRAMPSLRSDARDSEQTHPSPSLAFSCKTAAVFRSGGPALCARLSKYRSRIPLSNTGSDCAPRQRNQLRSHDEGTQ